MRDNFHRLVALTVPTAISSIPHPITSSNTIIRLESDKTVYSNVGTTLVNICVLPTAAIWPAHWIGDHEFPPEIAAHVTHSVPPYLLDFESRTFPPLTELSMIIFLK
ncbi:hypothetical protein N7467_002267 [Penicillium canescens]|nr:hypothetical protein N7467_002267 [Penicillium canescens]